VSSRTHSDPDIQQTAIHVLIEIGKSCDGSGVAACDTDDRTAVAPACLADDSLTAACYTGEIKRSQLSIAGSVGRCEIADPLVVEACNGVQLGMYEDRRAIIILAIRVLPLQPCDNRPNVGRLAGERNIIGALAALDGQSEVVDSGKLDVGKIRRGQST